MGKQTKIAELTMTDVIKPGQKLKWKFVTLFISTVSAVILLQAYIMYRVDLNLNSQNAIRKFHLLAEVIGNSESMDQASGKSSELGVLKNDPSVRHAYFIDTKGEILSSYTASGEAPAEPKISQQKEQTEMLDDKIHIIHPVEREGVRVGTFVLTADLRDLQKNREVRSKYVTGAISFFMLISFFFALWGQRKFLKPIIELAMLADKIGKERNFSLRAEKTSHDEVGLLVENFNYMLDEIEAREKSLNLKGRQLQRSNEQLEQFASIAAHDLQEPLRKVRAFVDRLITRCKTELGEKGQEYLSRLDQSVARMQTLINELLDFSRVHSQAKPFEQTDLNEVLAVTLSDLELKISEKRAEFVIENLPVIESDGTQIRQLFQNIISNSLKFHKPGVGPKITISATTKEIQNVTFRNSQKYCELRIEDNGIGFEEKYLDRIFQPFQRLHGREDYDGTGMGLAICKRIVERHNGDITASSCREGTIFTVTLPVLQSESGT